MKSFSVRFNDGKQTLMFHFGEELRAFKRLHNCHAWYANETRRNKRKGLFGHIHLPKMDDTPAFRELVAHEITHAMIDWVLCRKGGRLSFSNEERIATMTGEIARKFWSSNVGR